MRVAKKYIVMYEVIEETADFKWWMDRTSISENKIKIFDSFDEAKAEMRKRIRKAVTSYGFFPLRGGYYAPLEDLIEQRNPLRKVVRKAIMNIGIKQGEVESLNFRYIDDDNRHFAVIAEDDCVFVKSYNTQLSFNIHNMENSDRNYYFKYSESECGQVINNISVQLFNTNVKVNKKEELSEYETVIFGRYMQDKDDDKLLSDLVWRVLERKDGKLFLITEKVIDRKVYCASGFNNWENSDLRKWLNSEFLNIAFKDDEKSRMIDVIPGDKVSLLSEEEYYKFFPNYRDAKTIYTAFGLKKARAYYRDPIFHESSTFWWLRTPSFFWPYTNGKYVEYVDHITNYGKINYGMQSVREDGVRPIICIKEK